MGNKLNRSNPSVRLSSTGTVNTMSGPIGSSKSDKPVLNKHNTPYVRWHAEAIAHLAEGVIITQGREWSASTIVFVNDALCKITGYAAAELIGQRRHILQSGNPQRKVINDLRRELAAGKSCRAELIQQGKDGKPYHAEVVITPVPDSNTGLTTFVSVHRNITERKNTEQQLDQYRKDLRIMASELMLAEERERQKLAEQLHDGFSQTLFRARMKLDELAVAEPKAKDVAAILQEMGRMINTMTFELSPVVLRRLGLRHALKSLAANMQRQYALLVEIRDDSSEYKLSERMALVLFRSVRELLVNIAKHAKTETALISLKRTGTSLKIKIEDRGKGFDASDPFHHVESGHFGLFSIRERLEYLGGTITIKSAPGKGATIILNAPLDERKTRSRALN